MRVDLFVRMGKRDPFYQIHALYTDLTLAFTCPPTMSEAGGSGGGGGAVTISKGTKQPLVRVDDDLDVDSLLAEFTNLKFTIQKEPRQKLTLAVCTNSTKFWRVSTTN